jgi:uncharacterized protein YjgD (DUF1641 family)
VIEQLNANMLFVKSVLEDKESMAYLLQGMQEQLKPVDEGLSVIKETNQRFKNTQDYPNISLMRLFKLFKDPSIKKGFKYFETLLEVMSENEKRRG